MKILKINGLKKGWCDRDNLLLYSSFQILVDFVEKEKPAEIVYWSSSQKHRHVWKEIKELYNWWTSTRPARIDPIDDKNLKRPAIKFKKITGTKLYSLLDYDRKKYASYDAAIKKSWKLEKEWEKEDQKNLHRLINIRQYLWT